MIGKRHYQDKKGGTNSFDFPSSKMKALLAIAPTGSFERSDLIKMASFFPVKSNASQKDI